MSKALLLGARASPGFRRHKLYLLACAAVVLLIPELARAQTPPDAGSIRQQIDQLRRKSLPPKSEPAPSPPLESLGRETITVKHFSFVGNTLLTSEQLTAVVASLTARRWDFAELQNAAAAVANAYREAGSIVRAYLPRQNVTAGAITIEIVEAMFGTVCVEGNAKRVSAKRLQGACLDEARARAICLYSMLPSPASS